MRRSVPLALTCSAAAAVLGAGGASSGEWGPIHHPRVQHRHARAVVEQGAAAPGGAVAASSPARVPFVGSFSVPFSTPPPPLAWPTIAPHPPDQGDTDGLSTDIDDCNKGCIGGQPG